MRAWSGDELRLVEASRQARQPAETKTAADSAPRACSVPWGTRPARSIGSS